MEHFPQFSGFGSTKDRELLEAAQHVRKRVRIFDKHKFEVFYFICASFISEKMWIGAQVKGGKFGSQSSPNW
jgi:hypothetical protein